MGFIDRMTIELAKLSSCNRQYDRPGYKSLWERWRRPHPGRHIFRDGEVLTAEQLNAEFDRIDRENYRWAY